MNTSSLLVEIFVEELPFSATKRMNEAKQVFINILEKYCVNLNEDSKQKIIDEFNEWGLDSSTEYDIDNVGLGFFWTPRRIIIYAPKISDATKEYFGPPLSIAYDVNGNPTSAAQSFFDKLNITQDDVLIERKNDKECLYYKTTETCEYLIEDILIEWLKSLNLGKSMQWGEVKADFIRPIRNIFVLLNEKLIHVKKLEKMYGFKQTNVIHAHRHTSPEPQKTVRGYFTFLRKNDVVFSQSERRTLINRRIGEIDNDLRQDNGAYVDSDYSLLDEVVAINESPVALYGEFDEKFLELPDEVITTSMVINQKYFPCYKISNGVRRVHNGFMVVCNILDSLDAESRNEIVNGNCRVLRARLEDALFFYRNDKVNFYQNGTDPRLKNIEFIENFGSIFDKVQREKLIAQNIMDLNKDIFVESNRELIIKCIEISKNDLVTEMVNEFGELQGIMASYYTQNDELFKVVLKEQYLPLQEDTHSPRTIEGSILAMSHKLDNVLSLFATGKIPSGSKDPFGLRRNANGIIDIINSNYEFSMCFNLEFMLENLQEHYKSMDISKITQFFYERLGGVLNANQSIVRAALKSKERDLSKLINQILALKSIITRSDKNELKSLFKRVANILIETKSTSLDINLLKQGTKEECVLYEALEAFRAHDDIKYPSKRIERLLELKDVLKDFFDNVLILCDDVRVRENRILLVKSIYEEFLKVGDIREISF